VQSCLAVQAEKFLRMLIYVFAANKIYLMETCIKELGEPKNICSDLFEPLLSLD